jgi:hypothetical protein
MNLYQKLISIFISILILISSQTVYSQPSSSSSVSCTTQLSYSTCFQDQYPECAWIGASAVSGQCVNTTVTTITCTDLTTASMCGYVSNPLTNYRYILPDLCTWTTYGYCYTAYSENCTMYNNNPACTEYNNDHCVLLPNNECINVNFLEVLNVTFLNAAAIEYDSITSLEMDIQIPIILSADGVSKNTQHNIIWIGEYDLIENQIITLNWCNSLNSTTDDNVALATGVIFDNVVARSEYLDRILAVTNIAPIQSLGTLNIVDPNHNLFGYINIGGGEDGIVKSFSIYGDYSSAIYGSTYTNYHVIIPLLTALENCGLYGVIKTISPDGSTTTYTLPFTILQRITDTTNLIFQRNVVITFITGQETYVNIATTISDDYSPKFLLAQIDDCTINSGVDRGQAGKMLEIQYELIIDNVPSNIFIGPGAASNGESYDASEEGTIFVSSNQENCFGDTFVVSPIPGSTTYCSSVDNICSMLITETSECILPNAEGTEFQMCGGWHDFTLEILKCQRSYIDNVETIVCNHTAADIIETTELTALYNTVVDTTANSLDVIALFNTGSTLTACQELLLIEERDSNLGYTPPFLSYNDFGDFYQLLRIIIWPAVALIYMISMFCVHTFYKEQQSDRTCTWFWSLMLLLLYIILGIIAIVEVFLINFWTIPPGGRHVSTSFYIWKYGNVALALEQGICLLILAESLDKIYLYAIINRNISSINIQIQREQSRAVTCISYSIIAIFLLINIQSWMDNVVYILQSLGALFLLIGCSITPIGSACGHNDCCNSNNNNIYLDVILYLCITIGAILLSIILIEPNYFAYSYFLVTEGNNKFTVSLLIIGACLIFLAIIILFIRLFLFLCCGCSVAPLPSHRAEGYTPVVVYTRQSRKNKSNKSNISI